LVKDKNKNNGKWLFKNMCAVAIEPMRSGSSRNCLF